MHSATKEAERIRRAGEGVLLLSRIGPPMAVHPMDASERYLIMPPTTAEGIGGSGPPVRRARVPLPALSLPPHMYHTEPGEEEEEPWVSQPTGPKAEVPSTWSLATSSSPPPRLQGSPHFFGARHPPPHPPRKARGPLQLRGGGPFEPVSQYPPPPF